MRDRSRIRPVQASLALVLALALNAAPANAAVISAEWVLNANGDYDVAGNWNPAVVPLNGLDTYQVTIGNGRQVTYDTGLAGQVDTLDIGNGSTLRVVGGGSTYSTVSGASIDNSSLRAQAGGVLVPGAVGYQGAVGFGASRILEADGANSLLDLSSLTTLVRNSGGANTLSITAGAGGRVDLTNLAAFTDNAAGNGALSLRADGAGSLLDLPQVTELTGASLFAGNGGTVTGQLQRILGSTVTVRNAYTLDLTQANDIANSTFVAEDGAVLDVVAPALEANSLRAIRGFLGAGGARITTVASSYQGAVGFGTSRTLEADGAGSVLDLSSLTTLVRNSGGANTLNIAANAGGTVDLTNLAAFTDNAAGNGALSLRADGAGSLLDLPQVTELTGASLFAGNGGTVTGQLQRILGSTVTVRNAYTLDLTQANDIANSTFVAEDGAVLDVVAPALEANSLRAIRGFLGAGGARITTVASSYQGAVGFGTSRTLEADGVGSVLDLSSLTTLVRNSGGANTLNIAANAGGTVDLTNLAAFTDNAAGNGALSLRADGAGSLLDLPQVTELTGASLFAGNGGTVTGQLQRILGSTVTVRNSYTLDLTQANDIANSTFVAEDGAVLDVVAPALEANSLRAIRGFLGAGGARITTVASSYQGAVGFGTSRTLEADGVGSVLDLSSLTTLVRNSGGANTLNIAANAGGTVDLTNLAAFTDNAAGNGALSLRADGAGSLLDLPLVTELTGASLFAGNGGTVTGQLQRILGSTVTVRNAYTLDLTQASDIANSTFVAEDGAVLDVVAPVLEANSLRAIPGFLGAGGARITTSAATYQGAVGFGASRTLEADGAGSLLDLSSLTTLVRNSGGANTLSIRADRGARVDISSLAALTDNASGNGALAVTVDRGGVVDLSSLQALDGGNVTINRDGVVQLASLGRFSRGTFDVNGTGSGLDVRVATDFALAGNATIDLRDTDRAFVVGTPGPGDAPLAGAVNVLAGSSLRGNGVILGDYVQDAAATLRMLIGGFAPVIEFDVLDVQGTASLDGLLDIALDVAFASALSIGDSFEIITADLLTGSFSAFSGLSIGNGLAFTTVQDDTSLRLLVTGATAAPAPGTALLVLAGLLLVRAGRAGRWRAAR